MNINQLTMTDVISNVIEDLSMMAVEQVDNFEDFRSDFEGHIDFEGTSKGRLMIECTRDFASALAENLLGLEADELEEAHLWDAVGELLNVVCGNIVTELFDAKNPFTLSAPQVNCIECDTNIDTNKDKSFDDNTEAVNLLIDNHPVRFTVITHKNNA